MSRRHDADRRTRSATSSTGSSRRTRARTRPGGSRCPTRPPTGKNHKHEPVPGAERRARLRRRHRPVVVGPRRHARPRRLHRGSADAAGDGQPAVRHGRPARDAPGRARRRRRARHDGARPRRSPIRPAARPCPAATSRSPAPPPTLGGLVAAVEVSTDGGTTWSSCDRHDDLDLHVQRGQRPRHRAGARRGRRANIGTAASVTFTAAAQACPCSIFTPSTTGDAGERHERRRARREVPVRHRRLHHRDPLLQDRRQHRHAYRATVDDRRDEPGDRDLRGRIGDRLAGGDASARPSPSTPRRPTSPRTTRHRATTRSAPRSPRPASTTRRSMPSRAGSTGPTASISTAPVASTRPARSGRRTTSSTWSSSMTSGRTPPRRRSSGARRLRTPRASAGGQRHRDLQRADRPGDDRRVTSSCVTPPMRAVAATITYDARDAHHHARPQREPRPPAPPTRSIVRGGATGIADLPATGSRPIPRGRSPWPPPPRPDPTRTSAPAGPCSSSRASSPFGSYLPEILRGEGLNLFTVGTLGALTAGGLAPTRRSCSARRRSRPAR